MFSLHSSFGTRGSPVLGATQNGGVGELIRQHEGGHKDRDAGRLAVVFQGKNSV